MNLTTTFARAVRRSRRGFNVLEILVVLVLIGLLSGISYTMYLNLLPRMRLEEMTQEAVSFLRQARLDAIREAAPMVVTVEEVNDDGVLEQWLVANRRTPSGTLEFVRQIQISRDKAGVWVRGPDPDDDIGDDGFTFPGEELIIRPNGTVVSIGGLRISDSKAEGGDAAPRNVFQITYQTRAGQPVIEKWLASYDARGGGAGFYRQRYADANNEALWQWY